MILIKRLDSLIDVQTLYAGKTDFFQSYEFHNIFINKFVNRDDLYILGFYTDGIFVGYGIFEKIGNMAVLSGMKKVFGNQDVTDFGDIVISHNYISKYQDIWEAIITWFKKNAFLKIQLDYVRENTPTFQFFKHQSIEQEVSPRVVLPASWEEYLEGLNRKDRKELKRKIKRLETVGHQYLFVTGFQENYFNEFVRLHKMSKLDKNEFMSQEMMDFFKDLARLNNSDWKTCFNFLNFNKTSVASVMTFESDDAIYAYNSGFNPEFNYYSAGLILHSKIINRAIIEKKKIYDFLRGKERYKFDLGGQPVTLYQININL